MSKSVFCLADNEIQAERIVEDLKAAGFSNAKVVARFAEEGGDTSVWDVSTSYNEAMKEAERRRSAEGQK